MKTDRFFPIWLHAITACVALGVATDLEKIHSPWTGTVNGLAVGLGITLFLRFLSWVVTAR